MTIKVLGIDIGKHTFHIYGEDHRGKTAIRRKFTRKGLVADKDLSEVPSSQRRSVAKLLPVYELKAADRDKAIIMAYNSGGYSMKEIGDYFGLHYSRVSKIITKAKGKT